MFRLIYLYKKDYIKKYNICIYITTHESDI